MKLLLTGAFKYSEEQIEYIKSLGNEIVFVQDEREKLSFNPDDIEGVICNGLFLYNDIKDFKSLKYIQLTSAGFDRVPLDYINEKGIKIFNARGVYSIPMAEFAVCGILNLIKQTDFFYENKKNAIWEKSRTLGELAGKKAVIVGAGNIGGEVAKRLRAFDMQVIGVDLYTNENPYFDRVESLDMLDFELNAADVVVLTLPLNEQTKGMFNKAKFELLKKDAIFVNIARGGLVVENDLISALKDNTIGGAVLDVFESEPLDEKSELWNIENAVITPHNSFVGCGNSKRMFNLIIENLEQFKNE